MQFAIRPHLLPRFERIAPQQAFSRLACGLKRLENIVQGPPMIENWITAFRFIAPFSLSISYTPSPITLGR